MAGRAYRSHGLSYGPVSPHMVRRLLAGAALGGLLTSAAGLTAPLWLGLAAITTVIGTTWRALGTLRTADVSR
jgi:hypothetical protein